MPLVNDQIKITLVTELQGVQMQNCLRYRVLALGADPPVETALDQIATLFGTAIQFICSNQFRLTCMIYENETSIEAKQLLFVNVPGGQVENAHPQNQVVRINSWGIPVGTDTDIVRNAFNLSGVIEPLSTRGRVNDFSLFQNLTNLLQGATSLSPNWELQASVYGAVQDLPKPAENIKGYQDTSLARVNPLMLKLRGRTTTLCGV